MIPPSKFFRKIIYFSIIAAFILLRAESAHCAAPRYGKHWDPHITAITCSQKQLTLKGHVYASRTPAGADIYRAKIKKDGKKEKFKKIGTVLTFKQDKNYWYQEQWHFTYTDYTVKTGQAYAYKCRPYKMTGNRKSFPSGYSSVRKGAAARKAGEYTCKVLKNTQKKLIVKLEGTHADNGPLEITASRYADLRYKNEGEDEVSKVLYLRGFSYDNKKWYKERRYASNPKSFIIKGKESIYLEYWRGDFITNRDIRFSNYQYVQMCMLWAKYNFCHKSADSQIRFNFTSGKALVGNFMAKGTYGDPFFVWEGDIFERINCMEG